MKKFYFLGEFGYVFRQLLPFLETCTGDIELVTWPSVCKIIEYLWPGRYILADVESIISHDMSQGVRDCTHFRHVPTTKVLEQMGYRHFFSIDLRHQIFHDDAHKVFGVLQKKLVYGEQHKDKPYVSVFPRKRAIQAGKNTDMEDCISWIKEKHPDKKIVGHGFPEERFSIDISFVDNVYDQINAFNNSMFLFTPPSGLADFALACGCSIILTGDYKSLENTNPHGCFIKQWKDIK